MHPGAQTFVWTSYQNEETMYNGLDAASAAIVAHKTIMLFPEKVRIGELASLRSGGC